MIQWLINWFYLVVSLKNCQLCRQRVIIRARFLFTSKFFLKINLYVFVILIRTRLYYLLILKEIRYYFSVWSSDMIYKVIGNTTVNHKTHIRVFNTNLDNLALLKPAWQKYPYEARWGAYRAVDGLYSNLAMYGNQCTTSGNSKAIAEWRVDLGEVFSIHNISIQYRTDNFPWGKYNTCNLYMYTCCVSLDIWVY